jgi:hypothetical protein
MAKLIGELLFGLAKDLAAEQVTSIFDRTLKKAGVWADARIKGRARLIGLLLGLAAWGFFPLIGYLLAH